MSDYMASLLGAIPFCVSIGVILGFCLWFLVWGFCQVWRLIDIADRV